MFKTMHIKAGLLTLGVLTFPASQAAPLTHLGAGEGQLNIIAWPGYIERGANDKNYDWVTAFEKQTGCQVNVKTAATSDEMVSLMGSGNYDLVTASGDASLRLIYGKKVQAINTALIPSWKTLDSRLQNGSWFTVNGQHYGTPYQWGANFLAYNSKIFKTAPSSWNVVFEPMTLPDGKPNKGRVQAYDGPIYIADAAMYLMAKNPALGIKDPYELNETQYAAVLKLLRQQKQLTHRYWHDVTVQMNDFKNEGIAATSAWGYTVNSLTAEKFPIGETIPKEGATGWADTTMLASEAKHPVCSYKWMEWSLNKNLQSALAEWFGSNPVVPAACNTKAPGGTAFCKSNGFDKFAQIHFWKTPTASCKQGQCVPYSRWTADYIAIMGGR
ncbi:MULTISPECIES: ABC transporter substrate-binding protein [unclassified Paludibacterium]|uniref:ABC transporter substrate-binding protein n=1 Tax=unclassified Paludibacterium TaxID=2618429 RepID=UPI00207B319B|nr:ABC transporter substrate-binding protein [Paludibacterium sp. B53371]BEV71518.1 ABC transporter substrate-binding protein [Paludibacterium sp. THUN1379]